MAFDIGGVLSFAVVLLFVLSLAKVLFSVVEIFVFNEVREQSDTGSIVQVNDLYIVDIFIDCFKHCDVEFSFLRWIDSSVGMIVVRRKGV